MDALQLQHSRECIQAMMTDGALYVPCPRCRDGSISICTDIGDDFNPSRWESVTCPLCHGTREADAECALEWLDEQEGR